MRYPLPDRGVFSDLFIGVHNAGVFSYLCYECRGLFDTFKVAIGQRCFELSVSQGKVVKVGDGDVQQSRIKARKQSGEFSELQRSLERLVRTCNSVYSM